MIWTAPLGVLSGPADERRGDVRPRPSVARNAGTAARVVRRQLRAAVNNEPGENVDDEWSAYYHLANGSNISGAPASETAELPQHPTDLSVGIQPPQAYHTRGSSLGAQQQTQMADGRRRKSDVAFVSHRFSICEI